MSQVSVTESYYTFTVNNFFDPDGDLVQLSSRLHDGQPLPSWITFEPTTGGFVVHPNAARPGDYLLDVTGADAAGANQTVTTLLAIQARCCRVLPGGLAHRCMLCADPWVASGPSVSL